MLTWFFLILTLAIILVVGGLAARAYMTGTPLTGQFFAPRPEKRLAVIEQASVDNRRRLILIRRDGVEHLVMTGGPVDVVIETGINAPRARHTPAMLNDSVESSTTSQAVFNRPARSFGQAVNE
ncbi:MAG: hypothetical protein HOO99_18715 [Hyphomicrobiaceae bacterium]|nr:hypothetical protein [Hyphomicrobiaceae bacterium]